MLAAAAGGRRAFNRLHVDPACEAQSRRIRLLKLF